MSFLNNAFLCKNLVYNSQSMNHVDDNNASILSFLTEVVMRSSKKKVGRPVSRKRKHTGGKVWRNIVEQSKAFAEKESSQRPHKKVRQSKSTPGSYHCHICDRTLLTASNYQNHMKCALHKKRSKSVGRNAIKQEVML